MLFPGQEIWRVCVWPCLDKQGGHLKFSLSFMEEVLLCSRSFWKTKVCVGGGSLPVFQELIPAVSTLNVALYPCSPHCQEPTCPVLCTYSLPTLPHSVGAGVILTEHSLLCWIPHATSTLRISSPNSVPGTWLESMHTEQMKESREVSWKIC